MSPNRGNWTPAIQRLVVFVLMASTSAVGSDGRMYPVGRRKQLLVDRALVSTTKRVRRFLGRVEKANEGRPIYTKGRFYGTVLHDEGRFKMWVRESDAKQYGLAESSDGIRFERRATVRGINFAGDINLAVELNRPDAERDRRFIAGYDAPGMAAGVALSANGRDWTPINGGKPVTFRAADCHNQVFWDPISKVFRLVTRTDYGLGGGPLAGTVADDFEVRGTRIMTNANLETNPTDWSIIQQWYFSRTGPDEYLQRQIYSMTVWVYADVYFALMSVYEFPGDISEGRTSDRMRRHERDVMNFYIATSRDCDDWDLTWVYAGKPIVPRGAAGSFDKDTVFPSSTVVTHDDRHWLYYSGANERHGTAELKPNVWFEKDHTIGLATLPLDRFIGWHAGPREGSLTTRPFVLSGERLLVNVDAAAGRMSVDVLDEKGTVIPGFAGVPGERIDDLRWTPRWTGGDDLSALAGKTIQLRFRFELADLYAFQIVD